MTLIEKMSSPKMSLTLNAMLVAIGQIRIEAWATALGMLLGLISCCAMLWRVRREREDRLAAMRAEQRFMDEQIELMRSQGVRNATRARSVARVRADTQEIET